MKKKLIFWKISKTATNNDNGEIYSRRFFYYFRIIKHDCLTTFLNYFCVISLPQYGKHNTTL